MARKTKQKAEETRQQILDAAVQEFSAHGVSGTSLADIAVAAGVTRGAIYWHFKNKVDLFNEVWALSESKIDQLELEYQVKYPDNPLRILREILIYVLVSTREDCRRRALMEIVFHKCEFVGEMSSVHDARKVLDLASYERIASVLQGCIDANQLPANLDTHRAAIIMKAYITGLMENWLFMPESFDIKQEAPILIDAYLDMLVHSLSLRREINSRVSD
ncbi:multidrug efflux transporter transcriptional repressor AcrR [Yersinia pekkanenii]|uniref:DNA-binding transcriptional repressor AcrR n=1 Tax=Yersinia pekkanenii TaxID=1288385 RepID=A0A0T9NK49_9GAMM|nr:multidrug efflux transporter transcriptional repressor AcrR [Yersinia pekkanenii]CNH16156.1 DNA-binding transcriptional repressor AcrR [Yersinia pekkanenii]CRY65632.1 DNA-binding transcriptional repressor AcrR [Yersinia pekkanenii]